MAKNNRGDGNMPGTFTSFSSFDPLNTHTREKGKTKNKPSDKTR